MGKASEVSRMAVKSWPCYADVAATVQEAMRTRPGRSANDCIWSAFIWCETKQGWRFWAEVAKNAEEAA